MSKQSISKIIEENSVDIAPKKIINEYKELDAACDKILEKIKKRTKIKQ